MSVPASVREGLRHICVSLAHYWITNWTDWAGIPPPDAKFVAWVYSRHVGFKIPSDKRIKVTIELEDDPNLEN